MTLDSMTTAQPDPQTLLVSIVIPCFNYAQYVGRAIESVARQTHANVELIVVNDGSTDDSLAVIRRAIFEHRLADAIVVDQPNGGQVASRQAGYAACRGSLVVFLDADDLLEPGALSCVVEAWRPGVAKVQYDLRLIDARGEPLGRCYRSYPGEPAASDRIRRDFARFGTYRWPVTSGNAFARGFLEQVMPQPPNMPIDGYLNTIAPLYGEIVVVPRVLGRYRLHGANMSADARGTSAEGFSRLMALRGREMAALESHAQRRGVALPAVHVLDHELPFLSFRLIACKLGFSDAHDERDGVASLMRKGMRQVLRECLPWRERGIHLAWFLILGLVPRAVVRLMVQSRFNRDGWRQALKRRLAGASA